MNDKIRNILYKFLEGKYNNQDRLIDIVDYVWVSCKGREVLEEDIQLVLALGARVCALVDLTNESLSDDEKTTIEHLISSLGDDEIKSSKRN